MEYTFVTVVHRGDYRLLRLQARSLRRYLPPDLATAIYVVAQGQPSSARWRDELRADYGHLDDRVRLFDASDVAAVPRQTTGWVSQQILKLMVAEVVTTDHYVVLDAKNHLVFPLSRSFLEVGAKLRSRLTSYENHPMRERLENALLYFDVEGDHLRRFFLPTITPFAFPTRFVRNLTDAVAERERQPFPCSFNDLDVTEFSLFGAFLCSLSIGIDGVYDLAGRQCPVVWAEIAAEGADAVGPVIARAEADRLPFFSVHHRAIPLLDDACRQILAGLWYRRQLFDSVGDGVRFLADVG